MEILLASFSYIHISGTMYWYGIFWFGALAIFSRGKLSIPTNNSSCAILIEIGVMRSSTY